MEVVSASVIVHAAGASTGSGNGWPSPRMYYFAARNRWLFFRRYRPGLRWVLLNVMLIAPRSLNILVAARADGVPARQYFLQYLRGTFAGLTATPSGSDIPAVTFTKRVRG